jgi:hypothetical protein
MEPATAARCPGCGYENNPYFRYCGMCGSPLRAGDPPLPAVPAQPPPAKIPEPAPAMAQPALRSRASSPNSLPITINGMSILGLSNDVPGSEAYDQAAGADDHDSAAYDASRSVDYLLEDDEPRRGVRWGMYAALLLLAATAGTLLWHWQTNEYPWEAFVREQTVRHSANAAPVTDALGSATSSVTPLPKPSPAPSRTFDLAANSGKTEKSEAAASPAPEPENQPSMAPAASAAPDASASNEPAPDAAPKKEAVPPARKPAPTFQPTSAPQAVLSVAITDPTRLFTEGEKYLYGDGVAQDCDRAQKDLRTSAAHSYSQAESLLGTMYASGHCLGRDLPAAYRWYARALHHEPANTRISSDLQVLWSQMTPADRKAAQSSGQ